MNRQQLVILILFCIVSTSVIALPNEIYEGKTTWLNFSINNYDNQVQDTITLTTNDFEILDTKPYQGWNSSFTLKKINWTGGTLESNIINAIFEFQAKAKIVNNNTNAQIIINNNIHNITILNDLTSPLLSNPNPADNDTVLAQGSNILISINAIDNESGIKKVTFYYGNSSKELTNNNQNNQYLSNVDLSSYNEGDELNFTYVAENYAGLTTTYQGNFYFDGTNPTVEILHPKNELVGRVHNFRFKASDNFPLNLSCDIYVNSELKTTVEAENNVNTSVEITNDLDDGNYSWKVVCRDHVGLNDQDSSTLQLDSIEPTIILIDPLNNSDIGDMMIKINATDNNEVDQIITSQPLDTTSWSEGVNNLQVTAIDKAGNGKTENYRFIVDRSAPIITLISPKDQEVDVNVDFQFNVTDVSQLNCTVYSNNQTQTETMNQGVNTISMYMDLGTFTWYVTCIDQANNEATSSFATYKTVDLSGPLLTHNNLDKVVRNNNQDILATAIDVSGVKSVSARLDNIPNNFIDLTKNENNYQGTFNLNNSNPIGVYNLTYTAIDNNNYTTTIIDSFELIHNYNIDLKVNPNPASTGQNVKLSGTITRDDNTQASGNITITYPSGSKLIELINGTFEYTITAKSGIVTVSYETDDYIFEKSRTLQIASSGSGGGLRASSRDESSDEGVDSITTSNTGNEISEEDLNENNDDPYTSDSETQESTEQPQDPEEERNPLGVGQAYGLFNRFKANWWIVALLGGLLVGIYLVSRDSKSNKQKNNKQKPGISWDNYFERNGP